MLLLLRLLFLATSLVLQAQTLCDKDLLKPTEWIGGPLEFSTEETKSLLESTGRYIPKNMIATRAQLFKDDAILAIPRYKSGVPVTLAKVSLKQRGCEATLQPFPSWSLQEEGNCKALQSAVDVFLDPNDVLWVLDVGVVHTLTTPLRRCPPKVLGVNLKSMKVEATLDMAGLVAPASRLQYLAVEYAPDGRAFAYVTDAATRSILVFDIAAGRGMRVVLPPDFLADVPKKDVLYAALVTKGCGHAFLLFTYLSSSNLYAVRTDYLRTGSAAARIINVGPKPKKIVILGTDLGSAVFFRYDGEQAIFRWDSNTAFDKTNFLKVYTSPACLKSTHVFPDLKRIRMRSLESNFPDFIRDTVGCGAHQQISLLAGFENC